MAVVSPSNDGFDEVASQSNIVRLSDDAERGFFCPTVEEYSMKTLLKFSAIKVVMVEGVERPFDDTCVSLLVRRDPESRPLLENGHDTMVPVIMASVGEIILLELGEDK
jgi:hypothetical protein